MSTFVFLYFKLKEEQTRSQSLGSQAVNGAFWTYLQQFGTLGIQFIVTTILARLLEPAEFGLIGMITVFVQISHMLVQGGMTQSLIRTKSITNDDLSTVFYFNLGISTLLYGVLYICAPYIAAFYKQGVLVDILRVYSLVFVINSFGIVQITMLTKALNFKRQTWVTVVSLVSGATVGISLAYLGFGVWSLVYSQVVTASVATILYWITSSWKPSLLFNSEKFKYHFNFGYKLTLSGLLNTVFQNIYLIIIGRAFNATQLGYYTQAVKLRNLPVNSFSNSLQKVTFPLFSKCKDDIELKALFRKISITVIYIIAPILFFIAALSHELIEFLFTSKWLPAAPYLSLLCFAGILQPIHAFNLNILLVRGRSDLFFKLALLKKSLVVLILLISVKYGIIGLIIGQILNSLIALPINAYYINKYLKYSFWDQVLDLLPSILLSGGIAFSVFYFKNNVFSFELDLINLLIFGIGALLLYIIFSRVFQLIGFKNIKDIVYTKIKGLNNRFLDKLSKRFSQNKIKKRNKSKLFVIGFNKTGTTTIHKALKEFDIIVGDQRKAELLMKDIISENYSGLIDYCQTAEAFQDVPFSKPEIFKILDKEFQNSKFILTVRDNSDQWYNSISKFQTKLKGQEGNLPTLDDYKRADYVYKGWSYMVHTWTYGFDLFNKEKYIFIYEEHNKDVIDYFRNRPNDLLVINVADANSYNDLCRFINQKPLRDTFAWENKTSEIDK